MQTQADNAFDRGALLRRAGGAALALGVAPWWRLASAVRDPRVRDLDALLTGRVVGPTDAGYDAARVLYNMAFDGVRPFAVAYCAGPGDVARALTWARKRGVRIAVRSGGHSYAGYSTTPGLVLDVSSLSGVSLNGTRALVGAGARLVDVDERLAASGVAIPAGSCATIGISGIAQGGGHGFLSRKWGLTADNVLELELVTADGRRRVCSPTEHADLFWACRGGGGGNFGVVTRWTFRAHPVTTVATFHVDWPIEQLPSVLAAWQQLVAGAPDELFSILSLSGSGGFAGLGAVGQLIGDRLTLDALLAPLVSAGTPRRVETVQRPYLDAVRMWAGCAALDACRLGGDLRRRTFAAKSDYFRKPLPPAAATVIRKALEAAPTTGGFLLDSYGGAINRVPKDATAFVHRDSFCSGQYLARWANPTEAARSRAWLRDFYASMRLYASGEAYQNYIDPELASWRRAYYGSNFERLVSIKRRYDPDNVFRFAQSVPVRL